MSNPQALPLLLFLPYALIFCNGCPGKWGEAHGAGGGGCCRAPSEPTGFAPLLPFVLPKEGEGNPPKRWGERWGNGCGKRWVAGLGGCEERRVMGGKGAAGWAWPSRSGVGGHLPADSALRSEWRWVLCGARSLSFTARCFGWQLDAGPDSKMLSWGAGAAEGTADSTP